MNCEKSSSQTVLGAVMFRSEVFLGLAFVHCASCGKYEGACPAVGVFCKQLLHKTTWTQEDKHLGVQPRPQNTAAELGGELATKA